MAKRAALNISKAILLCALFMVGALVVLAVTSVDALNPDDQSKAAKPIAVEKEIAKPVAPSKFQKVAASTLTESVRPHDKFRIKRVLEIDEPFVHGYWIWDDEGIPDGEILITVDLKAESMSVFRDGYEIGAAVITFGDALKPTPTGVFPITQKSKDHISNIYGTPMPYMLRMTNDGISIHGTDVKWGWGTRGCIGVPNEFAALLFQQVKLGDRVIVTDGKIIDVS